MVNRPVVVLDADVFVPILRPVSRTELLGQLTGLFPAIVAAIGLHG